MEEFVSFPQTDSQSILTLNWVNHSAHILKQLRIFFGPGGMFEYDVNVACDGGTVKCHQVLLAVGSDYFADTFSKQSLERITMVELPEISAKTFRYIYQFMLNGTITLPLAEVNAFIKTGQKLKVEGLMHYLPKGLMIVNADDNATGMTKKAVMTISSNHATTTLKLALPEGDGRNQLVKTHEYDHLEANLPCSKDKLGFPVSPLRLKPANDETIVGSEKRPIDKVAELRANDENHDVVQPNINPERKQTIGSSQGSTLSNMMTGINDYDDNENCSKKNKVCDKKTVKESYAKTADKRSCNKEAEKDTFPNNACKKSGESKADQESFAKTAGKDSCEDETEKQSITNNAEKETNEKNVQEESCENEPEKASYEKNIEEESCKDETNQASCANNTEKESCEKNIQEELTENETEQGTLEKEVDMESCKKDAEKESSASKSNRNDGNAELITLDTDDSRDSDFKDSKINPDASKRTTKNTTKIANRMRVRRWDSRDQNRKRKNEEPRPSTSKNLVKRRRRGCIPYRGKYYTIKEAKEISVPCPNCYITLKLSNLKNHQLKNCKGKKKSSEKVSDKGDCGFEDCDFHTTDPGEMKKHMECHDEEFLCSTCGRKFMEKTTYDLHQEDCEEKSLGDDYTSEDTSEDSGDESPDED